MGSADEAKSGKRGARDAALGLYRAVAALITFPVAVTLALTGQFILASLLSMAMPAPEGASGDTGAAMAMQVVLLVVQGGALVYSVTRRQAGPGRIFLALAAFLWAVGSLLLMYVVLRCSVGGVCL
ncbi:MAG TPA: hypothetical protein DEA50_01270 [Parvularcula sp.]|nr:hypothetical protein [Parvularcula sp.]